MSIKGLPFFLAISIYCYEVSHFVLHIVLPADCKKWCISMYPEEVVQFYWLTIKS